MTAGYAGLFKTRHVPSLVVSSVMARMPLGSSVMLIVLLVNAQYGASAAGTATALMTGKVRGESSKAPVHVMEEDYFNMKG